MTTLKVEQTGKDLVIRLTPEAATGLDLRPGDEVQLARNAHGEIVLAPADMDHQMRLGRSLAFLRRFRDVS
jgi:hypothetical protein